MGDESDNEQQMNLDQDYFKTENEKLKSEK
jgi:hypothetical protein